MNENKLVSEGLHKCKSSLTVILGYIQLLQKDLADNPSKQNEKHLSYLKEVTKACNNINNIINEINPKD